MRRWSLVYGCCWALVAVLLVLVLARVGHAAVSPLVRQPAGGTVSREVGSWIRRSDALEARLHPGAHHIARYGYVVVDTANGKVGFAAEFETRSGAVVGCQLLVLSAAQLRAGNGVVSGGENIICSSWLEGGGGNSLPVA